MMKDKEALDILERSEEDEQAERYLTALEVSSLLRSRCSTSEDISEVLRQVLLNCFSLF